MDHERSPREHSGLSWAHIDTLSIVVLRPGVIRDARWFEFEVEFRRARTQRLLLFILGPVQLGSRRRRALTERVAGHKVAAIVDDMAGRSLVKGMRWSGVEVETHPLAQVRQAVATLGPSASREVELERAARLLEASELTDKQRSWLAPASRFRVIAVHA